MTIGTPDSARIARHTSMPLMPGSIRSSRTMSGRLSRNAASARSPSATKDGRKPSLRSTMPSISASAGSSSTTSTRALMRSNIALSPSTTRAPGGRSCGEKARATRRGYGPRSRPSGRPAGRRTGRWRRAGCTRSARPCAARLRCTGTNCCARVALVRDEEQPGVEPAEPVRAVDEVVAAAQQPGAVVGVRVGQPDVRDRRRSAARRRAPVGGEVGLVELVGLAERRAAALAAGR